MNLIELDAALREFTPIYEAKWLAAMRAKFGITEPDDASDGQLITEFLQFLQEQSLDFTQAFHSLAQDNEWTRPWRARQTAPPRNPVYIPRNHLVEEVLAAAQDNDLTPFQTLLDVLTDPFTERPGLEKYAQPAPDGNPNYRTFCGT